MQNEVLKQRSETPALSSMKAAYLPRGVEARP